MIIRVEVFHLSGGRRGQREVVVGQRVNFGRSRTNSVRLAEDDEMVSRNHAELRIDEGRLLLVDCRSQGGLFLDGQQIARSELQSGKTYEVTLGSQGPHLSICATWVAGPESRNPESNATAMITARRNRPRISGPDEPFRRWLAARLARHSAVRLSFAQLAERFALDDGRKGLDPETVRAIGDALRALGYATLPDLAATQRVPAPGAAIMVTPVRHRDASEGKALFETGGPRTEETKPMVVGAPSTMRDETPVPGTLPERQGGNDATAKSRAPGAKPALGGSHPAAPKGPLPATRVGSPLNAPNVGSMQAPKVLIGHDHTGTPVFWEPQRSDAPLNNFGILVTGDPGSGKTQFLRALIDEVARLGLPVCVFDFKNDYADSEFSQGAGLEVYDVCRGGLPFNPLALIPDDKGEALAVTQVHHVSGILRRVFKLGDQQEARLRRAMTEAYENVGIDPRTHIEVSPDLGVPSFSDVLTTLGADSRNEPLLNRLSPLFDLGLFPEGTTTSFEDLLQRPLVLDLHALPDDRIKAAVAEFVIVRLHGHILRGEQPRALRRLLVFDEAWRVKDSERLQELAREGRAFGVAIAVATQFPQDIKATLSGNLATQVFLHNKEADHQGEILRALCGKKAGQDANRLKDRVAALQKHEGFVRNQQHAPYVQVRILPHYARRRHPEPTQ